MQIKFFVVAFSAVIVIGSVAASKQTCEFDNVLSSAKKMVCREMVSEVDIDAELRAVRRFSIKELVIESSFFRFFPHDSFADTKFNIIRIISSSIMELTNTREAFEGLEDHLDTLDVKDASFVSHWDWNHLRNLRRLRDLSIMRSDLSYVSNTLGNISSESLQRLTLSENGIAWVHETAFAPLIKLTYLNLNKNEITAIKRSMFPDNIEGLGLGNNLIKTLPLDIFSNMPKLKSIVLSGNLVRTVDERIFGEVWGQLRLFQLHEGNLSCDCRMKWISTRKERPRMVYARCASPASLEGRYLLSLKAEELWC